MCAVSVSVSVFSYCESAGNELGKRWGTGCHLPWPHLWAKYTTYRYKQHYKTRRKKKGPRRLVHGHAPSGPAGRLWHGFFY